jgi:NAD(P)-dependent dehydrogenase (short-subunit alcohol dehydrogenase family)
MSTAVIVGASSGIGLAFARRLTAAGWTVIGLARRDSVFVHERYRHVVADVRAPEFRATLGAVVGGTPDLVVYAAGIGHEVDLATMANEADVFATNLTGAVITAEVFVPRMITARRGHLIGISSLADGLIDPHAPSYAASKAGLSRYLEGLALACRPHGVSITNVRFGFVDTAMAKSPRRPFMVTADRAARVIEQCIAGRPIRRSFPLRMAALMWLLAWRNRFAVWAPRKRT